MQTAAVKGLRRTDAAIARTVEALGKTLGGTWRAEEKAACTAAWLALSQAVAWSPACANRQP